MRLSCLLALVFTLPVSASDALDVLNAERVALGLKPYERDEGLSRAAEAAANYRAERLHAGHVLQSGLSDFSFLPAGSRADAAGCGAMSKEFGFGACCMYSTEYRSAGAAWVTGRDGRLFCHLFVRKGPPTSTVAFTPPLGAPAVTPSISRSPTNSDRLTDLDRRLSAAEQWGVQGGFRPVVSLKPASLESIDQRLRAMEQFGVARAGYAPPVKPSKVANVENLDQRLSDAERFGQSMGYVPPAKATTTANPTGKMIHCIMYSDMTKTKILKEWDEPDTGAGGPIPATRMPATTQNCPTGK